MGSRTVTALRWFQDVNDLVVDGVLGPRTMAALDGDDARPATGSPPLRERKPDPDDENVTSGGEEDGDSGPPPAGSGESDYASIMADYCPGSTDLLVDDPRLEGHSGAADVWNDAILVESELSGGWLRYIIAHECAHVLDYQLHGQLSEGFEHLADCVTVIWGLGHQHYASTCGEHRATAERIASSR